MPPSYARLMTRKGVFCRLETLDRVVVREGGVIIGAWDIAICRDFHGLDGYKQNLSAIKNGHMWSRTVLGWTIRRDPWRLKD